MLEILEAQNARATKRVNNRTSISRRTLRWLNLFRGSRRLQGDEKERAAQRSTLFAIIKANDRYVIDRLQAMLEAQENAAASQHASASQLETPPSAQTDPIPDARIIRKVIGDYELALALFEQRANATTDEFRFEQDEAMLATVTAQAMQLERDGIQAQFEDGQISRATAAEMRNNVDLLALRLQKDLFLSAEPA